jgi:predicted transcriptional regulator
LVSEKLKIRFTHRTDRVLAAIARLSESHPPSNREIADAAGILDQGQICKLLKRLAGLGLIENTGEGQPKGMPNAWRLTKDGERLLRAFEARQG